MPLWVSSPPTCCRCAGAWQFSRTQVDLTNSWWVRGPGRRYVLVARKDPRLGTPLPVLMVQV